MADAKDIPEEFQGHCAVAGDLLDTRIAEEKGLTAEYEGKKYYFCCPPCKPAFLANPAKYAGGEQEIVTLAFTDKEHVTDNHLEFSLYAKYSHQVASWPIYARRSTP